MDVNDGAELDGLENLDGDFDFDMGAFEEAGLADGSFSLAGYASPEKKVEAPRAARQGPGCGATCVEADDVEPKHAGSTFCRTNKGVVLVIGLLATSVAFWGGGGRQRNGFTSGLAALDSRQEKKRPAKPQPNQTNH